MTPAASFASYNESFDQTSIAVEKMFETLPLRIVMLTTVRFHNSKGGTEKVMIDTANAMSSKGHHVTILYRDKYGDTPGFKINKNIRTINCAKGKVPFKLSGLIGYLRSLSISPDRHREKLANFKLEKLACLFHKALSESPADIYITYEPKLSAMLVKEFGLRGNIITTFQFNPEHIAKRTDTKYIEKYLGEAGPIQILKNEFLERTKKLFPSCRDIIIIPNAIEQSPFFANLNSKTIINLGRISQQKNQLLLVEAFNLISSEFRDWKIEIWGEQQVEPNYYLNILDKIKKYNLEQQVLLCGTTNNVYDKLQKASIFAFPSVYEGFGLALAEAMTNGLPCIGLKDCPAINTLIQNNQNGILCENNKYALAEALKMLMSNSTLRNQLAMNAKTDIKKYSPQNIWPLWEKIIYTYSNRNFSSSNSTCVSVNNL